MARSKVFPGSNEQMHSFKTPCPNHHRPPPCPPPLPAPPSAHASLYPMLLSSAHFVGWGCHFSNCSHLPIFTLEEKYLSRTLLKNKEESKFAGNEYWGGHKLNLPSLILSFSYNPLLYHFRKKIFCQIWNFKIKTFFSLQVTSTW